MAEIEMIGQMDNSDGTFESANRVYNINGISPTIPTSCGGGHTPKFMDIKIVAQRGRDKTNPNHRGPANENYEQRLELREDGCTNTITTVQKDNYVLVKQATKDGYIPCEIGGGGGSELPNKPNQARQSNRQWNDKSNTNNGEYP